MQVIENLKVKEKLYIEKLENGLTVMVIPKPGIQKKYMIWGTNYGSNDSEFIVPGEEEKTKVPNGVAHFLEHKLFEQENGTNSLDVLTALGVNANAYTTNDHTAYLFESTDNFYPAMDELMDYVQHPYFTDENVEKEKGIIGQEIMMYDDYPDWRVYLNAMQAMYHNNPIKIDITVTEVFSDPETIEDGNRDDEFDTDNGFSGKVQYCLSIRDPRIADTSQSNGFESDNCGDASLIEPYTTAVFSNVTFIGPLGRDANFVNNESYITGGSFNPNNGSALGKFQSAMQIRRSSRLNCFNSVAVGYPVGLIIDGEKGNTVEMAKAGNIKLENIWFAGMTVVGSDANKVYDDVLYDAVNKQIIDAGQESYSSTFFKTQKGNKVLTDVNELKFKDGRNIGVNYMPDADSPVLTAASFNDALLSSGFETVEYIGAFGTDDNWLDGWTNFDPNNTDY